MRNQVFASWDEVNYEIDEFTLPADNQRMLDLLIDNLPDTDAARMTVDLADIWHAEENQYLEVGTNRTHLTLSNGTHLMISFFGHAKKYAVAWHPTDQDAQRDTLLALQREGEVDTDETEDVRLAALIKEVHQKYKAQHTY